MADYNPSSPDLIGLEFLPHAASSVAVQGDNGWVVRAPATVSETIHAIRVPLTENSDLWNGVIVDVYSGADIATAVPGAVGALQTLTVGPTADVLRQGWTTGAGGIVNLWSHVDDNPDSAASEVDKVMDPSLVVGDFVRWRFGGVSAVPAGRRIVDVRVRMRVMGGNIGVRWGTTVGSPGSIRTVGYTGGTPRVVQLTYGEDCPWTGQPWTSADLADLASGAAYLQVERADSSSGFLVPQIFACQIQVRHYAETRVAIARPGSTMDPDTVTNPMITPWAKAAGTTYWLVMRRYRQAGNDPVIGWRSLIVPDPPPSVPGTARAATVTDGLPQIGAAAATQHAPGFHLLTFWDGVTATGSVDSQPYGYLVGTANLASAGANYEQFTPAVSGTYGIVRGLVKPPAATSTTRLRIEIRRVSDNALMGSGVEFAAADVNALPDRGDGWRLVQGQMADGGVLIGGTAYRIVMSLVGGTAAWRTGLVASIMGETVVGSPGGFQGTTGYAVVNGSSTVNPARTGGSGSIPGQAQTADWMVQVGLLPDPLTSASAVVEALPLAPPRAPGIA